MKTCSKCRIEQPITEFHKSKRNPDGHAYWCRTCCRPGSAAASARWRAAHPARVKAFNWKHNIRRYGIDRDEWQAMLDAQGGTCANPGCGNRHTTERSLHIDHDHVTGVVRGLLCDGCNKSEGLLGGDVNRMRGLAEYLERTDHADASPRGSSPGAARLLVGYRRHPRWRRSVVSGLAEEGDAVLGRVGGEGP